MRHNQAILVAPLYIAVHFEPIMKFLNPLRFGLYFQVVHRGLSTCDILQTIYTFQQCR